MIRRYQQGQPPVEVCIINGRLVGPDPVPGVQCTYTCTNTAERGALIMVGINAYMEYPPGYRAPWELMLGR